jgi:hypothetical protein
VSITLASKLQQRQQQEQQHLQYAALAVVVVKSAALQLLVAASQMQHLLQLHRWIVCCNSNARMIFSIIVSAERPQQRHRQMHLQLTPMEAAFEGWRCCAACLQGLVKMRAACKLAAEVLNYAGTLVRPGITTDEIDRAVHDMTVSRGAYPSPLNYGKFPKSVCTSVNEVMCHGIPDGRCVLTIAVCVLSVRCLPGRRAVHGCSCSDNSTSLFMHVKTGANERCTQRNKQLYSSRQNLADSWDMSLPQQVPMQGGVEAFCLSRY